MTFFALKSTLSDIIVIPFSILHNVSFLSFYFQTTYVLKFAVNFVKMAYSWVVCFYPFCLIGVLRLFACRIIIETQGLHLPLYYLFCFFSMFLFSCFPVDYYLRIFWNTTFIYL